MSEDKRETLSLERKGLRGNPREKSHLLVGVRSDVPFDALEERQRELICELTGRPRAMHKTLFKPLNAQPWKPLFLEKMVNFLITAIPPEAR